MGKRNPGCFQPCPPLPVLLVITPGVLQAQTSTNVYTGSSTNSWTNAANWSLGIVRDANTAVVISNGALVRDTGPSGAAYSVVLGGASGTTNTLLFRTAGHALTVETDLTMSPGAGASTLSFTESNLTLTLGGGSGSILRGSGVRGTAFDAVDVGGLLTYDGALVLSLGTTFGEGSYSFNLFDFATTSGSFDSVDLGGLYSGSLINNGFGVWGLTSGVDTWTFTESSGLLALEVVPEPSTYALLVLASVGLGPHVVRRRRRAGRAERGEKTRKTKKT